MRDIDTVRHRPSTFRYQGGEQVEEQGSSSGAPHKGSVALAVEIPHPHGNQYVSTYSHGPGIPKPMEPRIGQPGLEVGRWYIAAQDECIVCRDRSQEAPIEANEKRPGMQYERPCVRVII